MILASIDIETTGLSPKTCQVLQLAIILYDTENPKPREECPQFNTLVSHKAYVADNPYALSLNSWIFDALSGRAKTEIPTTEAEFVAGEVADFLRENTEEGEKLVLTGKNVVGFDKPFLVELFDTPASHPVSEFIWKKFPHRAMDPGPMFARSGDKVPPNLKECLKRAGIDKEITHDALDDAWDVIECIKYCLL